MALRLKSKNFDIHRGLNDLSDIKRIEDDNLADIINFNYVPAAEGRVMLESREGTSKDTMSASLTGGTQIQGLESANFTGGEQVIFSYNSKLYQLAATPTELATGLTDAMNSFAMIQDTLIIANGTDVVKEKSHGATTISNVAGTPGVFKYVHQWHNFLWGSGITANKNRIQGSALANRASWPAGNINDRPYGEINGIHGLGDTLYIFYNNHIEALTGFASDFSDFQFSLFANIGCISHYGVVSNGDSLFFPTRDGIYAIGGIASSDRAVGGVALIKVNLEKIKTFWSTLDLTIGLIHGVHDADNRRIRWSVRRSGQSINDRELIFDYDENILGFSKAEGRNISSYSLGISTTGKHTVRYGDSRTTASGGLIMKLDTSVATDDGTTISGTIIPKSYDMGKVNADKRFISVDLLARGKQTAVPVDVHFGVGDFPDFDTKKTITTSNLIQYDAGLQYDVGNQYAVDNFKNYLISIRKRGKALALKFISSTASKGIRISGWALNFQDSRKKTTTEV